MARCTIYLTVEMAFWVKPYVYTCVAFAKTFGVYPNEEKIVKFICDYGVKVKVGDLKCKR